MPELRQGLTPLPENMRDLPIDERGYCIPFFVDYLDGKPEFRAMDPKKYKLAIERRLCWVCGKKLGVHVSFPSGPMCGANRISSEPPSHHDCAVWSAINCPFLANPNMVRRQDDLLNNTTAALNSAGTMVTRNPGVVMIWNTREYQLMRTSTGPIIMMGEPESIDWYCEGREATRDEILHSLDGGMPYIEAEVAAKPALRPIVERQIARLRTMIDADYPVPA